LRFSFSSPNERELAAPAALLFFEQALPINESEIIFGGIRLTVVLAKKPGKAAKSLLVRLDSFVDLLG
jgi:hypothetical protein